MTSPAGFVRCDWKPLRVFAIEVLKRVGTPLDGAQYIADQIVESDLAGHESHGVRRLSEYVRRAQSGHAKPTAQPTIDLESGGLVRIDGDCGFGHLVMRYATDVAIDRARKHGISGVAVHNCEWAGRFAPFCEYAAEQGIAILMFVNDSGTGQDVAPPGGTQARLATNPIAAGIPRAHSPHLVLDMATAAAAMGRISEMRDRGEHIPAEWVTANGLIRPAAGFKGFGLALVAEALAGALTTAGVVSATASAQQQGVFIVAINVDQLRPLPAFVNAVESFIDYVTDVPLEEGATAPRIPGSSAVVTVAERRQTGVLVNEKTWQKLTDLATEFAVPLPTPIP